MENERDVDPGFEELPEPVEFGFEPSAEEPEPTAPEAEKRTPLEWAQQLGHIQQRNPKLPQSVTHADIPHATADKLHGWSEHAYHHQGEPFLVTREDYELALKAALAYPTSAPHGAALPPGQEKRFEGFEPRAARNKEQA